jgi:hypothetical protein
MMEPSHSIILSGPGSFDSRAKAKDLGIAEINKG